MVKEVKYIYIGLKKKRLVWVFYNRGERDKDNGTGLKERGGIEILTTVLHSRAAPSRFAA